MYYKKMRKCKKKKRKNIFKKLKKINICIVLCNAGSFVNIFTFLKLFFSLYVLFCVETFLLSDTHVILHVLWTIYCLSQFQRIAHIFFILHVNDLHVANNFKILTKGVFLLGICHFKH